MSSWSLKWKLVNRLISHFFWRQRFLVSDLNLQWSWQWRRYLDELEPVCWRFDHISFFLQLSRWTSRWEVVEQLHPGHICVFVMCHSSDSWLWSVLSLLIAEDITCISPQQYSEALLMYWSYEILGVMGILFLLINMGVTSGWVLIICSLMGFYQLFANTDWLGWPSTWHRTHVGEVLFVCDRYWSVLY